MQVCIQPFCQRTRWKNQFQNSWGASSDVSEFRLPTLLPRRANRIPRSASSATFHSSQPPARLRAAVRKWFDVPPSAIGISSAQRIDEIEQCGVLDGEKPRQPRIVVISDGQARLKAVEADIRGEPGR